MASSWWPHGQAEHVLEEHGAGGSGCLGPKGTPESPCSEPDLITAHTGHSIDVAQHWEADETSAGEEATSLRFQKFWPAAVLSHRPVC